MTCETAAAAAVLLLLLLLLQRDMTGVLTDRLRDRHSERQAYEGPGRQNRALCCDHHGLVHGPLAFMA